MKRDEINKIRFRASDNLFTNTECVLVEYNDCLQLPWLVFLSIFRNNEKYSDIFDFEKIKYLSDQALLEFYFNRKNENPLYDLLKENSNISHEELDKVLENTINSDKIFFSSNVDTLIVPIVKNIIAMKLAKKVIVYYPVENEFVKEDVFDKFGKDADIVFGPFDEVLDIIPQDTTYILSDVFKVITLAEKDKLKFSGILLPNDYRYNFVDDSKEKYLINMDSLSEQHVFKWARYLVA